VYSAYRESHAAKCTAHFARFCSGGPEQSGSFVAELLPEALFGACGGLASPAD
jgi:hypothetical protein